MGESSKRDELSRLFFFISMPHVYEIVKDITTLSNRI